MAFAACARLSATYLGVSEGTIQWTLCAQLKKIAEKVEDGPPEWMGMFRAAGGAKMTASLITYPAPRGMFSGIFYTGALISDL